MLPIPAITCQRATQVAEKLPSAPRVLAQLQEMLQDTSNGIEEVTVLMRRDPGLTARVIRIANGVVFGRGDGVVSLDEALARVGFNEVFHICGLASLVRLMNFELRFYGVSRPRLRENSLLSALLMEELAPGIGADRRACYTAGLLRSVGKVVLDATAQSDLRGVRPLPLGDRPLLEWERAWFGPTNTEVAEHVMKAWRIPFEVHVPVRDHYLHEMAVDPLPVAKLLHVVTQMVEERGLGLPGRIGIGRPRPTGPGPSCSCRPSSWPAPRTGRR